MKTLHEIRTTILVLIMDSAHQDNEIAQFAVQTLISFLDYEDAEKYLQKKCPDHFAEVQTTYDERVVAELGCFVVQKMSDKGRTSAELMGVFFGCVWALDLEKHVKDIQYLADNIEQCIINVMPEMAAMADISYTITDKNT